MIYDYMIYEGEALLLGLFWACAPKISQAERTSS
jgi:hypothetical protein